MGKNSKNKKKGNKGGAFGSDKNKSATEGVSDSSAQIEELLGTSTSNEAVKKIEDEFIAKVATSSQDLEGYDGLPVRPGHGSGQEMTVRANYFEVIPSARLSLFIHPITITEISKGSEKVEYVRNRKTGEMEPKKVPATRVRRLIEQLLEEETDTFPDAITDYSSFIILGAKLEERRWTLTVRKEFESTPQEGAPQYSIDMNASTDVSVSGLKAFLSSTDVSPQDRDFVHKDVVKQVLNIAVSKYARKLPRDGKGLPTVAIFKNKIFNLKSDNKERIIYENMLALRGVFKSVRPATGRILLNVNTSHCVVLPHTTLKGFFRDNINQDKSNLVDLQRQLKRVKIYRTHLEEKKNADGVVIPSEKTIWGLSSNQDGKSKNQGDSNTQETQHAIKFNGKAQFGAGPKDVLFWLKDRTKMDADDQKSHKNGSEGGRSSSTSDGRYISVYDYFHEHYPGVNLNPYYPVVNVGSTKSPVYLPAEVCKIVPGQRIKRKLPPDAMKEMIKLAVQTPNLNEEWITGSAKDILGIDEKGQSENSGLAKLGITIGKPLITVSARKLTPPQLKYASQIVSVKPDIGSWNLKQMRLHTGSTAKSWSLVWFQSKSGNKFRSTVNAPDPDRKYFHSKEAVIEVINDFRAQLKSMGITLSDRYQRKMRELDLDDEADSKEHIEGTLKELEGDLLIIILPLKHVSVYRQIKTFCDTSLGRHSVCMLEGKLVDEDYRRKQYFANVALKVNQKLGGVNHVLANPSNLDIISQGKTMVVGLDVTHPQPGCKENAPSIAGIVASVDSSLSNWPAELRVQRGGLEIVPELKDMFTSRLKVWQKSGQDSPQRLKPLPDNIIIYRDGVSEGQYKDVLKKELAAIEEACNETYKTKRPDGSIKIPRLTVIIVGKRHHTRFYPNSTDATTSGNCKPGTVCDRGVTEVRNWDFYLQAHDTIKGMVRPAHYFVIKDEIFRQNRRESQKNDGLNAADDIERLTFNMCHLFARATKSISICPPAYYADLLCERARCYLSRYYDPRKEAPESVNGEGDDEANINAALLEAAPSVKIHETLKNSMFYL